MLIVTEMQVNSKFAAQSPKLLLYFGKLSITISARYNERCNLGNFYNFTHHSVLHFVFLFEVGISN